MCIKVVIADDHEVVRAGMRTVIERKGKDIKVVGEAANGKEVINIAKKKNAKIFILDIAMPLLNGIETTERLLKLDPNNKIIIFSMHEDRNLVERVIDSGAMGYLLKEKSFNMQN